MATGTEPLWRLVVTGLARHDIVKIVRWSVKHFGAAAAKRYEVLILQAMRDIEADPERPGTARPELMGNGVRTYHLSFSRTRMPEPRVRTPRHFLIYRYDPINGIVLARVLHDSRDLVRHLPPDYRR